MYNVVDSMYSGKHQISYFEPALVQPRNVRFAHSVMRSTYKEDPIQDMTKAGALPKLVVFEKPVDELHNVHKLLYGFHNNIYGSKLCNYFKENHMQEICDETCGSAKYDSDSDDDRYKCIDLLWYINSFNHADYAKRRFVVVLSVLKNILRGIGYEMEECGIPKQMPWELEKGDVDLR